MSVDGWNTILVLGGIRSGKSEYAESLIGDAPSVRYVATSVDAGPDDPDWAARIKHHRTRRPGTWTTEEIGADPHRLAEVIATAKMDETLLVDDLGGWVTALLDPARQPADDLATIDELATAIRGCAAQLVLVSPEVGLSLVPTTPVGRAFADALGATNQAVADACDSVVLVVAGQPSRLKPEITAVGSTPTPVTLPAQAAPTRIRPTQPSPDVLTPNIPDRFAQTAAPTGKLLPTPAPADTDVVIEPGMDLPLPDEDARAQALDRIAALDVPGAGLGDLERVVGFAAATQGNATPTPWQSVRVLLLHGDHEGGAAAGSIPGESARQAAQARAGIGPLARQAAEVGATLQVVDAPSAAPIEAGPALSAEAVEAALRYGWQLADEAVDAGVQLIVLAACGAGSETAASAVLAANVGAEPVAVLGRVIIPGQQIDDTAWMIRCGTVRDAMHRSRTIGRSAKGILAELGGGDIAIATGVLLGATARRTPVLLDGPVGLAAGLISRDLAGQARHWCLLPDHGRRPGVKLAAEVLGLEPLLDLRLDLGEGATSLATLPLLRSAIALAGALTTHPLLGGTDPGLDGSPENKPETENEPETETGAGDREGGEDSGEEFVEPEPAGPGPATPEPVTPEPVTPAPASPTNDNATASASPGTDNAAAPRGA
ncbi:bifunctional adenosylcobinamide kinase/adenosylcobinamide-phosphate guanylyltransferase [Micromonospora sp. NPDC003197]